MEIEKLIEDKISLEKQISALLDGFHKEHAGIRIEEVDMSFSTTYYENSSIPIRGFSKVKITIKI
jgi:hypothetical protein